ncbi:MAG: GNAT family N-acetyltransferase [Anaerolineales bacterium]
MTEMPPLQTERLVVRPFVMEDLQVVHRLLDIELAEADLGTEKATTLAERAGWLQWSVLNYSQLAMLHQPPYGDRAVVLQPTDQVIGACGFVPCLKAFQQLPAFASRETPASPGRYSTEFGLFYAISPVHQRQGYATEAAQALVDYAFRHLGLTRIVATTTYDNPGSIGVMRKLGMQIEKNPLPGPPWLQVVGVLEAPSQIGRGFAEE